MRFTITNALILKAFFYEDKKEFENYSISPGTHFLEEVIVGKEKWLCLEGRYIGQSVDFWKNILNKILIPKCEQAIKYFEN